MVKRPLSIAILAAVSCCPGLLSCGTEEKPATSNKIVIAPTASGNRQQDASLASIDKSPMDMSYYPVEFAKQKMLHDMEEPLVARVIYSRPKKNNRVIFGDVIKYGAPWRLGANEATEIEFFKDVTINGKQIRKGRYIFYCIPYPNQWKLILNDDLFTWGLKFDSTRDAYNFSVPVKKAPVPYERFTMEFEKASTGMELHIAWDSTYASVPIIY